MEVGQTAVGVEHQAYCRGFVRSRWQCIFGSTLKTSFGFPRNRPKNKPRSKSKERQIGMMVVGVAAENDHRFPEKEFTLSWAQ